jgi:hypothetical protein
LQDFERLFCKCRSSLSKFGFSTPRRVPTEVEEAISKWCNEDEMECRTARCVQQHNELH